jgi:hypothetical protein
MSKTINLNADGSQFAEIKEPGEMFNGDRKAVRGAVSVTVDENGHRILPGDFQDQMTYALAARAVVTWNLQWPLPGRDITSLDKLTMDQFDRLSNGLDELREALNEAEQGNNPSVKGSDPTAGSAS